MDELPLAFAVQKHDPPALEVRVNFGLVTGRAATPAEVDRLAAWLLDEVGDVTIIAEDRHEIGHDAEASVQLVRVEVPSAVDGEQAARIVERCEHWAKLCASERAVSASG